MISRVERTAIVLGGGVEGGGVGELGSFFRDALLLGGAELGQILFAMATKARFLQLKIAELFFVGEEGLEFNEAGAGDEVLMRESFGELRAASGVDGHLERGDAQEPPFGVGNGLHQEGLANADGVEFFDLLGQVLLIGGGILAREQDRAAGETCFDSIQAGAGFALGRARPGGKLGVSAIRSEASFGAGFGRPVERAG